MKQFSLSRRTIFSALAVLILIAVIVGVGVYASGRAAQSDTRQVAPPTTPATTVTANANTESVIQEIEVPTEDPVVNTPAAVINTAPKTATTDTTETADASAPASTTTPITSPETVQKTETTKIETAKSEPAAEVYTAALTVRGPAGAATYAVDVDIGASVQDLMNAATTKGFSFKTKNFSSLGTYVTTINGVAEDTEAGMYWTYSVNGKKATSGISSKKLKKGDTVEWKYEKAY